MIDSKMFSDKVKESFKWLVDLGYQFKQIDNNIYFEKVKEDEAFAIGFSWTEYNEILVNGIIAYKRFDIVENVLQRVTKEELDFTIKKHWTDEVPKELENIKDQQHFENAFFITNTSEVDTFSRIVKEFYETDAKNFFSKYTKLDSIIEEMEQLPSDKKSSMIVNTSNSTFMRIMAIKHFVNPEDGEAFYKETIEELSPLKSQQVFSDILQKMDNLKTELSQLD